ncbi:hypothetical protein AALK46_10885, partial [Staphylococcus nepalensis]|uniref:hypothetical protein n=1 Tax=Staphylococcus nepalensis TaxID=214473 RepID=UPI0035148EFE
IIEIFALFLYQKTGLIFISVLFSIEPFLIRTLSWFINIFIKAKSGTAITFKKMFSVPLSLDITLFLGFFRIS